MRAILCDPLINTGRRKASFSLNPTSTARREDILHITSDIAPNFRTVSFEIEAWFCAGQPFAECPDWVQSKFQSDRKIPSRAIGHYALRDDEGYFWRWMDAVEFKCKYERITP